MVTQTLGSFEIQVTNIERAKTSYENVFALKINKKNKTLLVRLVSFVFKY